MSGHFWRLVIAGIEVAVLSALVLVPRCANYEQVLVDGTVYFTDADCYARMTRVRMCLAHPGLIVRHHDFENFPAGTTPHTTAPLDYLILALAISLRPLTAHALDVAGAMISPLLALMGGWFLWWWARRMKFRFRWPMLIVFAVSPILVQGTGLGRPDHQSLLIVMFLIALCAEWRLCGELSPGWSITAGCAWGLSLWVSLYEPLILLTLVMLFSLRWDGRLRSRMFVRSRRLGWFCFLGLIAVALLIERRVPSFGFVNEPFVRNWTRTIGELHPVPLLSLIWLQWVGCLIVVIPLFVWWQRQNPALHLCGRRLLLYGSLGATFLLTIMQARWGYFLVATFVIALPVLLESVRQRWVVWIVFFLSLWPMAQDWEDRLWPNDDEQAVQMAERMERVRMHELALMMKSEKRRPFLAPWWLSPSLAYWSKQPAVAGSSHESIAGIVDAARFYASTDPGRAREIVKSREVRFVVGYDADRVAKTSEQILGQPVSEQALCYVLDRAPTAFPGFLALAGQNSAGKLFQVGNNR